VQKTINMEENEKEAKPSGETTVTAKEEAVRSEENVAQAEEQKV